MGLDKRDDIRRLCRLGGWVAAACLFWPYPSQAQTSAELQAILARLDRLEEQNRALSAEVQTLKEELAAARRVEDGGEPTLEERLAVQESRTAEQAQTKVEAAGRFPIRLTGMALFNAHLDSGGGARSAGATFRQSTIGLDFSGPRSLWGARVSGSLRLDLYGEQSGQTAYQYQTVRLRTAAVGLDWKSRSLLAGLSKPIISPREPESLAHVAVSPLSGAGNLWMWLPQVRFQQEFRTGEQSGARFQIGVVETRETTAFAAYGYQGATSRYEASRPGLEARVELFGGGDRRFEIAPGFHRSVSHVAQTSIPSEVYSLDWLVRLSPSSEFTGAAFTGRNVTPLGTGALRQGVVVYGQGEARAVRSIGGWGQFTYRATPRLWFNLFTGQQDDRDRDLPNGGVGKNLAYGANLFFRLAPNVLASLETSQTRARHIGGSAFLSNRYDLALAYLF